MKAIIKRNWAEPFRIKTVELLSMKTAAQRKKQSKKRGIIPFCSNLKMFILIYLPTAAPLP